MLIKEKNCNKKNQPEYKAAITLGSRLFYKQIRFNSTIRRFAIVVGRHKKSSKTYENIHSFPIPH